MPMRNFYRQWTEEQLTNDQSWRDKAFQALKIIESGDPSIWITLEDSSRRRISFRDVYCQGHWSNSTSLIERIMMALAWQRIVQNEWIYTVFQVRESPRPDKDIQGNNDILNDMVRRYPGMFTSAEFWGGTQGEDGRIEFRRPAIRDFRGYGTDAGDARIDFAQIPRAVHGTKRSFPLEVGYCLPDQIETHLMNEQCVARFPYGYDFIIFIEDTRDYDSLMSQHWAKLFDELVLTDDAPYSKDVESTGQLRLF